jgi:hypothetical protein
MANADASWDVHQDSTSQLGWAVFFANGSPILSNSHRLRGTVPKSSAEAELEALSPCVQDVVHVRALLEEILQVKLAPTPIEQDNQPAIKLVKMGPGRSVKSKSMRRKVFDAHFLLRTQINPYFVPTAKIMTDGFTKALALDPFTVWSARIQNVHSGLRVHLQDKGPFPSKEVFPGSTRVLGNSALSS